MAKLQSEMLSYRIQARRYPLRMGPFLFTPECLDPENWSEEFARLAGRCLRRLSLQGSISIVDPSHRQIRIGLAGRILTIDGDEAEFDMTVDRPDLSDDDLDDGPIGHPLLFIEMLANEQNVRRLGSAHSAVSALTRCLYASMLERFQRAVGRGSAIVTGRVGSELADLRTFDLPQVRSIFAKLSTAEGEELDTAQLGRASIVHLAVEPRLQAEGSVVTSMTKARGAPPTVNHDVVTTAILAELERKGLPQKGTSWNNEAIVRAVQPQVDAGRTAILKIIPPAIQAFKKRKLTGHF